MELIKRKDVPTELTWDLTALYDNEEKWRADAEKVRLLAEEIERDYKGRLTTAEAIQACLDKYRAWEELVILTVEYCSLAASVDYGDASLQERSDAYSRLEAQMVSRLSFIDSEIIAQDETLLRQAAALGGPNQPYLEDLLRQKPYQLQPETERVLAALRPAVSAPYQIYNMAKLADMKFPAFRAEGEEHPLGYSLYEDKYEYDPRTEVRREAYKAFYGKLREYENVTAAAYQAAVQGEKIIADQRGHKSVFDYLLFWQKVDRSLYDRQIDLIMEKLAPHMRKYARLLQKIHGLDRMTYADLKLPVDPGYVPPVTIEESRKYKIGRAHV